MAKPLRICVTSIGSSLSTRGFTDDEFIKRINRASRGQIQVIFIKDKRGFHRDNPTITLKNRWLPLWVSYLWVCLRNLPSLIRQDILIADGMTLPGLIVCLFCQLFRKKSMITIHGYYDRERAMRRYSWMKASFFTISSKVILRLANLFVVNDQQIGQYLVDKGVESPRLFTRYVFADTEKFSRGSVNEEQFREFKAQYRLPDKYILYVGKLDNWDGAGDMLQIFGRIHDEIPTAKCVLVGKGPLKSWVNSFIGENNLSQSAFQIDWISYELMPYVYYNAELVILPNHPPQGGVSRINLEALSMEVPVIAYDIGEIHKVIRDGKTGYLIPENEVDLMADRAISLLTRFELNREFGANGRRLVQTTYDIEIYLENWIQSLNFLRPFKE